MGRPLGLMLTAVAAAAAKPLAPRPAASPWAAEPPSADDAVRRLHKMMPRGEQTPEEEAEASFEAFQAAVRGAHGCPAPSCPPPQPLDSCLF